MLLFQVKTTHAAIDGWLNKYIVFSGMRILKKNDLEQTLKKKPKGYQIEAAINQYFINTGKKVRWTPCSAINPNKLKKDGFLKGFLRNVKMELSITSYTGVIDHWKQILFFGREKLEN